MLLGSSVRPSLRTSRVTIKQSEPMPECYGDPLKLMQRAADKLSYQLPKQFVNVSSACITYLYLKVRRYTVTVAQYKKRSSDYISERLCPIKEGQPLSNL